MGSLTSLDADFGNYSAAACFGLPFSDAVSCHAQHLNVSDPPSTKDWEHYPFLWEPTICLLANVTYSARVNVPENFNWCTVPLAGSDVFLFVSLALIAAACLFGKLSAVWVLVAGGCLGAVNNWANLREISNAISLWLGISPPDLFFFAFLPPLLVDTAIRIDFFMFSKLWVHSVLMAFVMVAMGTIILTPLILFVLGFAGRGFNWAHGALFASMIASTDALAASAILKAGGGPEKLVVLMEGEALLNDASAITLFEVFLHLLMEHREHPEEPFPSVWASIPVVVEDILKLASIGAAVGWLMSVATGYLLGWLRWRGAKPAVEITIILAVAYLSFYVGQSPAKGSGVISVVVFGLWGNFTSKWGMLSSAEESGAFDAFWDTLSFASNGLVFFWAGVASINYFIRSIDILGSQAWSYAAIPLIWIFMVLIRIACLALFNITAFAWIKERLTWAEVAFTGWAGLRGAISLIMTADFIAHSAFLQGNPNDPSDPNRQADQVNSDIAIWTAAFVLLTLTVNAPSVSAVMHWLRLDRIPLEKQAMRAKAKRALVRFTGAALDTLRDDDEEFLMGANWEAVGAYVDISKALKKFDPPPAQPGAPGGPPSAPPGGDDSKGGAASEAATPSAGQALRKSFSQAMLNPLRGSLLPGTSADIAADTVEAAAGGRGRSAGALASLGGLFRSPSMHVVAGRDDKRGRRSRSRSRHSRRSRSRQRARRQPGTGLSETDSGGESDGEESATSSSLGSASGSDWSDWEGGRSAGLMLGEVVEECPFLDDHRGARGRSRQSRRASSSSDEEEEEVPAPAGQRGDLEMGLQPSGSLPAGADGREGRTGMLAATGAALAAAARKVTRSSSGGTAGALSAVAIATPPTAAPEPAAAPELAAAPVTAAASVAEEEGGPSGTDGEGMTAEELRFVRGVQAKQRQAAQARPALGALFAPSSEDAEPAACGDMLRPASGGALATVTEHQQLRVAGGSGAWHQQPQADGDSAAPAAPDDLYYSSMPAAVGRQLQQQLQAELQGGGSADLAIASPFAAAAAVAAGSQQAQAPEAVTSRAASSTADKLYYSSMPAAMGRQMQQQLQQQLAAATPDAAAGGAAAALSAAAAGDSPPTQHPSPAASQESPRASYYSSVPAAVGKQLAQQLAAERAAAAIPPAAAAPLALAAPPPAPSESEGVPESPRATYYSSVPAAVGRRMAEELAAERAASAAAAASAPAPAAAPAEAATPEETGSGAPSAYYSSLPAAAGRTLQRQLQEQLAAARQPAAQPEAAAATAGVQQQQEEEEQLAEEPSPTTAPSYSTMPAAMGRRMQQQLRQQLRSPSSQLPGVAEAPSAASSTSDLSGRLARPPRPHGSSELLASVASAAAAGMHPMAGRPPSGRSLQRSTTAPKRGPAWEEYHRTVTGAAGPNLAAELKRQLEAQRSGQGLPSPSPIPVPGAQAGQPAFDLLGRRLSRRVGLGGSGSSNASGDLGPLPSAGPSGVHVHRRTPSGGAAAVLPAATPLSEQLQARRARTMGHRSRDGSAAAVATAALVEVATAADVRARLTRASGSVTPHAALPADTSWQHKPLRKLHSARAHRGPADIAAAAAGPETSGASGEGSEGAAAGMAPATMLLARTYSGPPGSAAKASRTSTLSRRGVEALQRVSFDGGMSRDSSLRAGGAAMAMLKDEALAGPRTPASPGSAGGGGGAPMTEGALAEMRSRLIAGLKRYFHAKRMEGLLSVQGLRILEYACDHASEHAGQPMAMWPLLLKEVQGKLGTRVTARCLMWLARGWRAAPRWLQACTSWPVRGMSGFLRRLLGRAMLVSCEVAVEYYLSLCHSPQIQWMQQTHEAWPLQQEVEGEVEAAYRFIIDREIEAPDRFQAIQSYRAAMAVLRQQLTFVHELYESGMVDHGEKEDMLAPLDKRLRHLEMTGPVWKPPRPRHVLRGLPFMQALPEELFRQLLVAGTIQDYRTGDAFWASTGAPAASGLAEGPGVFVVLSGVIRRVHTGPGGGTKDYYQGIGGVVGSLLAVTGTRVPGSSDVAVAEGNSLGKGPMLAHLPQSALYRLIIQPAAQGDPAAQEFRLQLLRLAAVFVVESCEPDVVAAMQLHLLQLATAKAARSAERKARSGRNGSAASPRTAAARDSAYTQQQQEGGEAAGLQARGSLQRSGSLGLGLGSMRHSSSQHRSAWQAAAEEEAEQALSTRQSATAALQQQAAPSAPGSLRQSKSFGGHLAELMQQIAQEEFEELHGGGAGGGRQHLPGLEEGLEEPGSPRPASGTSSMPGSAADLAGMAAAADGAPGPEAGAGALANGGAARLHGHPHRASSHSEAGKSAKSARAARTRAARIAVRGAPQYALEVLADLKRGLPAAVLLELPAGVAWRQSSHAVLLQGGLVAKAPPEASFAAAAAAAAPAVASAAPSVIDGPPRLRRASVTAEAEAAWEAGLVATAAAASAPRVLPWLCCTRYRCNAGCPAGRLPADKAWVAGGEGALLLVCLSDSGEVPAGVAEAELAAARAAAASAAMLCKAASEEQLLRSHPLDLGGGGGAAQSAAMAVKEAAAQAAAEPEGRLAGLRRLMPWQHRYTQPRAPPPPPSTNAGEGTGGDNSSSAAERSLRVPLERLVARSQQPGRSMHSAR